jgi:hypothetical protein
VVVQQVGLLVTAELLENQAAQATTVLTMVLVVAERLAHHNQVTALQAQFMSGSKSK